MVMELRFGLSHTDVLLGKDTELSANDRAELEIIMQRLLRGEPVQYVLGKAEFCGRTFRVTPDVLIPRPETEGLITAAMRCCPPPARVLDIGTGSGCIAISLAVKGYHSTAFDISDEALKIARFNAARWHAEVDFRHEDILHPTSTNEQWDIIISNPPYICKHEADGMEPNVLNHEPHTALFVPDNDPLLFHRAISRYASGHLSAGGWLVLEINRAFGAETCCLLEREGFVEVTRHKDEAQNDRIVLGRKA